MLRNTTPSRKPWKVMSPPSWATAGRTRRVEQILDRLDDFRVGLIEVFVGSWTPRCLVDQHRRAGHVVFHDDAENGWLQMLPFAVVLA